MSTINLCLEQNLNLKSIFLSKHFVSCRPRPQTWFKHFSFFQRFLLILGVPAFDASYDYQNDADNYYNGDEEYYNYDTSNGSNEEIFDATGKKEVVNKRDPMFMSQPKKLMVNEGDIVKLPCVVDKFEGFVIMWKKGEKVISVGDNIMDSADTRCENQSKNSKLLLLPEIIIVSGFSQLQHLLFIWQNNHFLLPTFYNPM